MNFRRFALFFLALTLAPCLLAASPLRQIGPEGYADDLKELTFPDPQDKNFLVATAAYDIWVSHDGGASWRSALAHQPFLGNVRLAIDPFDKKHWIVRGTDDLLESRDSGITWAILEEPTSNLIGIFFDQKVPGQLFLQSITQTLRSRDGGQSWQDIPPAPALPLLLLTSHQGFCYFSRQKQLWRFDPAREEWLQIANLTFQPTEMKGDPAEAGTLYARSQGDLYRSLDGGTSFSRILQDGAFFGFHQSAKNPQELVAFSGTDLHLSQDRGNTWISEPIDVWNLFSLAATFDPQSGELLFTENEALTRRTLDGNRSETRMRGLFGLAVVDLFLDTPRNQLYALSSEGVVFRGDARRRWSQLAEIECTLPQKIAVAPWNPQQIYVTCLAEYHHSRDGGETWEKVVYDDSRPGYSNRIYFGPGSPGSTWLVRPFVGLDSLDLDVPVSLPAVVDAAIHPDAAGGVLAVVEANSSEFPLYEWTPTLGWLNTGGLLENDDYFLAQDPRNPNALLAAGRFASFRSFDRGRTWQSGVTERFGKDPLPRIDPLDSSHMVVGGFGDLFESHDGAASWQKPFPNRTNLSVLFDDAANLYLSGADGIFERSAAAKACPNENETFCAREGRFELSVQWTTANGEKGEARKVVTGNEESGLFYFFDANNWELLVKVLDGCGINDRFWVFTAGTTDVEYLLRVEDRYTGKIRTYFNQAGKAAEATTDTDAFATCGAEAAAGPAQRLAALPAEAPAPLELMNGRFEVGATWTNFEGQTGFGTPTPLRSANSGLFWFFSPDNWEVLLKVLDGCAINGHYWVLAAATTNVGYTLTVNEKGTPNTRTYSNPVGTPSPAQIDLEAFACPVL